MIFTDIRLQNYRSYKDASFELGSGVNIVVGPNAIGKTNLLEALIYSTGSSSYRGKDQAVIRHKADWARIDTHTSTNQSRTIKITKNGDKIQKAFEIDQRKYIRLPLQHTHPVVLFEPNNLYLLTAEPSARREYIDEVIAKYDPGHNELLRRYRRALAQRNKLLKYPSTQNEQFFVWNIKLAELAEKIVKARKTSIDDLNKQLSGIYSSAAGKKSSIELKYISPIDISNYSSGLLRYLDINLQTDKERGFTGAGPHREDILFLLNGVDAARHASRGEVRTIILSLKIFELELVNKKLNKKPLLLLDDVFSELDGARRKALTSYLKNHQTIITTTDADVIVKQFSKKTHTIAITN